MTTNESGVPLFQSEATGKNADGPLRNDTPLEESGDPSTTNNITLNRESRNTFNQNDSLGEADAETVNSPL